jgi:hypothetical protein
MTDRDGFEGEIVLAAPESPGAPSGSGALTARFVRYPGSQQVMLWLPQDGPQNYTRLTITGPGGTREDAPLEDRLNGRIQILIDTFSWPPGDYMIRITHRDGWCHTLTLLKLAEGISPPSVPPPAPEPATGPIVYRDGLGKVMPETDLELRKALQEKMAARFARHLEFDGTFRGGTIIYVEGEIRIPFSHEMCAGGVHFSIDVPIPGRWEAATGRPLSERDDIIAFLAFETRRLKASSWHYRILEDRIDFVD